MRIEQLDTHIANLERALEGAKKVRTEYLDGTSKGYLKNGDKYFYINLAGEVLDATWTGNENNKIDLSLGNVFKTREDAQKELFARRVVSQLRQQPGVKGFISGHFNCHLVVRLPNHDTLSGGVVTSGIVGTGYATDADCGWQSIYFKSWDAAVAAIKEVGADNILKAASWLALRAEVLKFI